MRDLGLDFYSNHSLNYIIPTCCVHVVLTLMPYTLYVAGRVMVAMEINLWIQLVDNDVSHMWILLLKECEVML